MLYVRELAQLATQTCIEQLLAMFRQLVINTPTSYFVDEEQYTGHVKVVGMIVPGKLNQPGVVKYHRLWPKPHRSLDASRRGKPCGIL